jgi:hypothetical protein
MRKEGKVRIKRGKGRTRNSINDFITLKPNMIAQLLTPLMLKTITPIASLL